MKGVKKVNFGQGVRHHLSRLHPKILKNDNEYQLVQQLRLSTTVQAVSSHFKERERLVKALAKATLPLNLFRDVANKEVLNALINLQHIPDHRTLTEDLEKLAESKLQQLKTVDFFRTSVGPLAEWAETTVPAHFGVTYYWEMGSNTPNNRIYFCPLYQIRCHCSRNKSKQTSTSTARMTTKILMRTKSLKLWVKKIPRKKTISRNSLVVVLIVWIMHFGMP